MTAAAINCGQRTTTAKIRSLWRGLGAPNHSAGFSSRHIRQARRQTKKVVGRTRTHTLTQLNSISLPRFCQEAVNIRVLLHTRLLRPGSTSCRPTEPPQVPLSFLCDEAFSLRLKGGHEAANQGPDSRAHQEPNKCRIWIKTSNQEFSRWRVETCSWTQGLAKLTVSARC